ncbi:MAG: 3-dehydroquinate synthase [Planctomycetaceae bacterium]|nr:3-dehydroquinate synthase [Planctomycetaceae bacterium]
MDLSQNSFDVSFEIPAKHRLRFTRDVFGDEQDVLSDLLEPSGDQSVRLQFWIDQNICDARPDLKQKLNTFVRQRSDWLSMAGNIQLVPGGEEVKNDIHILERMLKVINHHDLDRRSYIVVIGGGAVLDAIGFAAAIAHRGIRLIRLPATTLSQDDSGIGVKNAVNLFGKKNWLGSFNVPWAVINDASLLETLSNRDFIGGFSEAVKVFSLKDADSFDLLCQSAEAISQRDMEAADPIIRLSAWHHLNHITRGGDPFEALEARPLDFGHWSAHKLESMTNFDLRHGEAVAIGVAIDSIYSSLLCGLPETDARRIVQCLRNLGFDLHHEALDRTDELFGGLEEFRQHLGGRLTLTMLRGIGDPYEVHEVEQEQMLAAIDQVASYALS